MQNPHPDTHSPKHQYPTPHIKSLCNRLKFRRQNHLVAASVKWCTWSLSYEFSWRAEISGTLCLVLMNHIAQQAQVCSCVDKAIQEIVRAVFEIWERRNVFCTHAPHDHFNSFYTKTQILSWRSHDCWYKHFIRLLRCLKVYHYEVTVESGVSCQKLQRAQACKAQCTKHENSNWSFEWRVGFLFSCQKSAHSAFSRQKLKDSSFASLRLSLCWTLCTERISHRQVISQNMRNVFTTKLVQISNRIFQIWERQRRLVRWGSVLKVFQATPHPMVFFFTAHNHTHSAPLPSHSTRLSFFHPNAFEKPLQHLLICLWRAELLSFWQLNHWRGAIVGLVAAVGLASPAISSWV